MKKTLIALAAVAATSAFAQSTVTITGGIAYGYQSTTTTADASDAVAAVAGNAGTAAVAAKSGAQASGFGMDTAAFKLTATEDLGGGLKATGSISAGGLARGTAVTGEDMSLNVSGAFGSVLVGQIEIGSGIRGLAQAGAPVNNMEGEVLAPASAGTDIVKFTAPAINGFTFSGSLTEAKGLATGLEAGATNVGTSAYTVGVAYANGPLKVSADTTSWDSEAATGKADNRYRLSANYSLGVATIGAGLENQNMVGGGTNKYTMIGVSAPFGAVTVGAVWAKNDTSATDGDKAGYSFGASYALSKRTAITADYSSWDYKEGSTVANKKTTLLLAHSF